MLEKTRLYVIVKPNRKNDKRVKIFDCDNATEAQIVSLNAELLDPNFVVYIARSRDLKNYDYPKFYIVEHASKMGYPNMYKKGYSCSIYTLFP